MTPAPEVLSESQITAYRADGFLVLENRIPADIISALRDEVRRFEEEARRLTESNDRLDLEDSHTPEAPRLRRIKLPHTVSAPVRELMCSDHILAPARDLLGPDIRLHTTKLNMKKGGYGAAVEWHQDFAFYPHTNDDLLAAGVMLDDMTDENGPLMVFPGAHTGPVYDHHQDGVFIGAIDMTAAGLNPDDAVRLTGPTGSVSFHHARAVHGSAVNRSDRDRRMLFIEMAAADAFPVMGSMTVFDGIDDYNSRLLCGAPTSQPRLAPVPVRIPQPQPPLNRSIYEVQDTLKRRSFDRA